MSFIGKMFGGGDMPPVAPAPPPPSLADPAIQAAADELRRRRGGKGRASTILAPLGEDDAKPGARTLLGAGLP